MKGITPVIAIILLLLVTVAIVGLTLGYFQRIFTTTSNEGERSVENVINNTGQVIFIENALAGSPGTVTIRNLGSAPIQTSTFSVYVNNVIQSPQPSCTPTSVAPNQVTSCTVTCGAGSTVRVAGVGSESRETCR
ncbi:MAG: hypothetical protein HYY37_03880 [Candidatus Aenigmarchaeota archaeon]|nr:hypothetical protein [Candidatus Aenigmarchaeota archaeon]